MKKVFLILLVSVISIGMLTAMPVEAAKNIPVTGVEIEKFAGPAVVPPVYYSEYDLARALIIYPSNATNKKVTWKSSDKSIATVNEKGLVTSKKRGKVTITVTTEDGGFTDSVTFDLLHPKPSIRVLTPVKSLLVGQKTTLKAESTPYKYPLFWRSLDTSIAEVDEKTGVVTAKKLGVVEIETGIQEFIHSPFSPIVTCKIMVHSVHSYVSMRIGSPKALLNGSLATIDNWGTSPFKMDGRTMIPIRFISEKMGGKVSYTSDKAPIYVRYGNVEVELKINKKTMKITRGKTAETITLDVAAHKRNGRVYLPLRAVSQALGFDVKYRAIDGSEYIVVDNLRMTAAVQTARFNEAKKYIK